MCEINSEKYGFKPKTFSDEAKEQMLSYAWPGNIRELRNVVERLLILGENKVSKNDVKLFASK